MEIKGEIVIIQNRVNKLKRRMFEFGVPSKNGNRRRHGSWCSGRKGVEAVIDVSVKKRFPRDAILNTKRFSKEFKIEIIVKAKLTYKDKVLFKRGNTEFY